MEKGSTPEKSITSLYLQQLNSNKYKEFMKIHYLINVLFQLQELLTWQKKLLH